MPVNMAPIELSLPGWVEYDKAIERVFYVKFTDLTMQTWAAAMQKRSGNTTVPAVPFIVNAIQTSFNGDSVTRFTLSMTLLNAAKISQGEYSWDMQDSDGYTWFKGSLKITRQTTVV